MKKNIFSLALIAVSAYCSQHSAVVHNFTDFDMELNYTIGTDATRHPSSIPAHNEVTITYDGPGITAVYLTKLSAPGQPSVSFPDGGKYLRGGLATPGKVLGDICIRKDFWIPGSGFSALACDIDFERSLGHR